MEMKVSEISQRETKTASDRLHPRHRLH